jgi:hypothetical protein
MLHSTRRRCATAQKSRLRWGEYRNAVLTRQVLKSDWMRPGILSVDGFATALGAECSPFLVRPCNVC